MKSDHRRPIATAERSPTPPGRARPQPPPLGAIGLSWRAFLMLGLALAVAATAGCATDAKTDTSAAASEPKEKAPPILTSEAKMYLKNMFLVDCATEYLAYRDGEGPPVPMRSEREWDAREAELDRCLSDVTEEYTTYDAVRTMTRTRGGHTLSDAEMRGIVTLGDTFLEGYVDDLLAGERERSASAPTRPTRKGQQDS